MGMEEEQDGTVRTPMRKHSSGGRSHTLAPRGSLPDLFVRSSTHSTRAPCPPASPSRHTTPSTRPRRTSAPGLPSTPPSRPSHSSCSRASTPTTTAEKRTTPFLLTPPPHSHSPRPLSPPPPPPPSPSPPLHQTSVAPTTPTTPTLRRSASFPVLRKRKLASWLFFRDAPAPGPKHGEESFHFLDYVREELNWSNWPEAHEPQATKRERIYNFLVVPIQLEKLLSFGFFICLDSMLFLFTFFPLRLLMALLVVPRRGKMYHSQVCDLLRGSIILLCSLAMYCLVDISMVYHYVRGQAVVKLYVIFNVLEIFDRLCSSFGLDILDSLFWTSTAPAASVRGGRWRALADFAVALGYVLAHSMILFYQVVTFTAAINSNNNALLALLVSNNFVELKGSVFKRFEKENVFQIACSDMVERFQLFVFMAIMALQNLSTMDWVITKWTTYKLLETAAQVFICEVLVDWIKHAFVTKFNRIPPDSYPFMKGLLCKDIINTKNFHTIMDHSHAVSRRIGFSSLPLTCLIISFAVHARWDTIPILQGRFGWAVLGIGWLCLCMLKLVVSINIIGYANRKKEWYEKEEAKTGDKKWLINPDVERFAIYRSRIP